MKIIHTSDWHLGNNFHGYDRTVEHRHFLAWLLETLKTELPDVLVVAGDIFDSANPSAIAEGLFFDFLLEATEVVPGLQIVVIAGNHDSAGRIDAPAELLKRHNIYVRGAVRHDEVSDTIDFENLILPLSSRLSNEAEVVCLALPYLRPYDYPSGMNSTEGLQYYFDSMMRALDKTDFRTLPVIAVAHFYAAGADICENEHSERLVIGGQDCVSTDVIGRGISYTALGHIHRAQKVESRFSEMYYAGSALPMSFTERGYSHGVQMIELSSAGAVEVSRLGYSPLRRLLCIPYQGTATVKEVFEALQKLPVRTKNESDESWPYLEIRLHEQQPEPTLLNDVTKLLADKAVHFCRMVRDVSQTSLPEMIDHPRLQTLSPLKMAQQVFEHRYQGDMPEELEKRFKEAENLCLSASHK